MIEQKTKPKKSRGYWKEIENCKKEALKYDTEKDFKRNNPYVYNLLNNNSLKCNS